MRGRGQNNINLLSRRVPIKNAPKPAPRIKEVHTETGLEYRLVSSGQLHNEGGPARVEDDLEEWYYKGELYREDGPARIRFQNKKVVKEEWFLKGVPHRLDGPAVVSRHYDAAHKKTRITEKYIEDGQVHREDGPAVEERLGDQLVFEQYYKHGKLHREDGPSFLQYNDNGKLEIIEYEIEDELHNEHGPAQIRYIDGDKQINRYFLNDQQFEDEADWERELENRGLIKSPQGFSI